MGNNLVKIKGEKTLADHARKWHEENGRDMGKYGCKKWRIMYKVWIDFAFADF